MAKHEAVESAIDAQEPAEGPVDLERDGDDSEAAKDVAALDAEDRGRTSIAFTLSCILAYTF